MIYSAHLTTRNILYLGIPSLTSTFSVKMREHDWIRLFGIYFLYFLEQAVTRKYEGWNFNSGNYLFTTDTK